MDKPRSTTETLVRRRCLGLRPRFGCVLQDLFNFYLAGFGVIAETATAIKGTATDARIEGLDARSACYPRLGSDAPDLGFLD